MSFITEQVARRLTMLTKECKVWNENPHEIPKEKRDELSMMFGSTFHDFRAFAELGMLYLGFKLSTVQADIAEFMQKGQAKRMYKHNGDKLKAP